MKASPPSVNSTAPRYCSEPAGGQVGQRVGAGDDVAERAESVRQRRLLALRGIGDLVAAEQEAQRDQQTARGDERDHVAHAGEQDLPGAGAPADAAGGRGGSRQAHRHPPSTRAAFGLSAAASASATILSGSLMARLTPDATTGLPANRCLSFTPTSVAKMTASAPAIVVGGQRRAARRALRLDMQRRRRPPWPRRPASRRPCRCARCRSGRR